MGAALRKHPLGPNPSWRSELARFAVNGRRLQVQTVVRPLSAAQGEARNLVAVAGLLSVVPIWRCHMIRERKSSGNIRRAGRLQADLGQKEAELEKKQAELETASEGSSAIWQAAKLPRPLFGRRRKSKPNDKKGADRSPRPWQ
jgi:hypothetical protein